MPPKAWEPKLSDLVQTVEVETLRELGEEDARRLAFCGPNGESMPETATQTIAFRQRMIAKLMARGMKNSEVAAAMGTNPAYISILSRQPHFQQMVLDFQEIVAKELTAPRDRIRDTMIASLDILNEHIANHDVVPVDLKTSLDIFRQTADRCGHAPVQKNLSVSHKLTREELRAIMGDS